MSKIVDGKEDSVATSDRESAREDVMKDIDLDLASVASPVLARLIEEVRNEGNVGRSYDRTYHRHNR